MTADSVLLAFLITAAAGLSTGIGSALALLTRTTHRAFLSIALGFSAGVMVYVSFVEILPKGTDRLQIGHGDALGLVLATAAFLAGFAVMAAVDRLLPAFANPHDGITVELMDRPETPRPGRGALRRMGMLVAIAVALHNFPEGIATFLVLLEDPALGIALAIAVAIHNIPEGIAVSVPIYHDTGSRLRAFGWSFASGLSEPLGALAAYLVLRPFVGDDLLGVLFAVVAGVMVFIALDELLPAAREYGRPHLAIYGAAAGMATMALSLVLVAV